MSLCSDREILCGWSNWYYIPSCYSPYSVLLSGGNSFMALHISPLKNGCQVLLLGQYSSLTNIHGLQCEHTQHLLLLCNTKHSYPLVIGGTPLKYSNRFNIWQGVTPYHLNTDTKIILHMPVRYVIIHFCAERNMYRCRKSLWKLFLSFYYLFVTESF